MHQQPATNNQQPGTKDTEPTTSHNEPGTKNQEHPNPPTRAGVAQPSPKRIWILNPFDQLPNETDVPLRYWALCRTLAAQGHEVIWWSSDFSHLTKSPRTPCPPTDGFSIRLIPTSPYLKNISLARLKNHKQFAQGFYDQAIHALRSGQLPAPDRIVVSIPPLGIAEQAFRIRDYLRKCESEQAPHAPTSTPSNLPTFPPSHLQSCEVIVDIMDAWPETFYQLLPQPLRPILGPLLLAPMHRSARRAYQGADKISAVGQNYLDLAANYLGQEWKVKSEKWEGEEDRCQQPEDRGQSTEGRGQNLNYGSAGASRTAAQACTPHAPHTTHNTQQTTPTHLCYHGTDLARFAQRTDEARQCVDGEPEVCPKRSVGRLKRVPLGQLKEQDRRQKSEPTHYSTLTTQHSLNTPLRAVYLGAMGSGYDLQTILEVAARWKDAGVFPWQIHFAGDGPQLEKLKARCRAQGLMTEDEGRRTGDRGQSIEDEQRSNNQQPSLSPSLSDKAAVVFHGYLGNAAITDLLLSADIALVPNRPDSLVACPYKAGEYAAAGLPMLSCLGGELGQLLQKWNAGSEYNEGDSASLQVAFEKYAKDLDLLNQQSHHARTMAAQLFDRSVSYQALADFIIS